MSTNKSVRLMERQIVKANFVSPGVDLGEWTTLEVAFQFVDAGGASAGTVSLQHAAADEEDLYENVGTPVNLYGSATVTYQSLSFLKYVRWIVDGNVNGLPLASIEVVAKDH
jgi:hypothetical protein